MQTVTVSILNLRALQIYWTDTERYACTILQQMHAEVSIVSTTAELGNLSCLLFYFVWKHLKYFRYVLK